MKKLSLLLLLITPTVYFAQIDSVLVSDVKFKNSKFNNPHAGSGFLLEYDGKTFGITAKHVLFFAKTDSMTTISFGDELESWDLSSKSQKSKKIKTGKLINENTEELIEMPPKGDWLIFEIEGHIPEDIVVYSLREKPLDKGDEVRFLGYPYKAEKPVSVKGSFLGHTDDNNLRLEVPNGVYGGCSGGPVLDESGKLVGIVSMGYFNQKEQKFIFEPASLEYFKAVMQEH
ncbi:serine protease [Winogradskyella sp. A2]|uniref:S1 family peptidase n=1 Tax=Winogradskyella sp. A2 TaxID=3366944 RepID=UPI00398C2939